MRNRYNPYAKSGQDQYGKVCFYIYNDDGTQVIGPTGPKFCYSAEKAAEMVKKAESAGKRVSPSSVSPGPRTAPGPVSGASPAQGSREANIAYLESRFPALLPLLNHHLVKSMEGIWGRMEGRTEPKTIKGIEVRHKYAVLWSRKFMHAGKEHTVPEFTVDLKTLELARADGNGHPRPEWKFGHIDEVIARGQTLHPRSNPMGWV